MKMKLNNKSYLMINNHRRECTKLVDSFKTLQEAIITKIADSSEIIHVSRIGIPFMKPLSLPNGFCN